VRRAGRVSAAATSSPVGAALGPVNHTYLVDPHQLLVQSGIALAIMTVVSALLGWVVAGRVPSPWRTITARTRRISEERLHDRIALSGPQDEVDELLVRLEAAVDRSSRLKLTVTGN
jgi:HAMP domain-containing protein